MGLPCLPKYLLKGLIIILPFLYPCFYLGPHCLPKYLFKGLIIIFPYIPMLIPGSSLFAKVSVEGFNDYFTIYIPMLLPGSSLFAKVSI